MCASCAPPSTRSASSPPFSRRLREAHAGARAAAEGAAARATVPADPDEDARKTLETLPPVPSAPPPAEPDGDDDDDRTVVAARPAIPPRADAASGGRCAVAAEEVITAALDDADLARVDALAAQHGVAREEMLARLAHVGVEALERRAEPAGGGESGGPARG